MSFALWELRIPILVQLLTVLSCTSSCAASSVLVSRPLARSRSAWLGSLLLRRASSTMRAVERLALAGAVTGGVERLGGLGVGVGVEELIERGEGVGVGLADLPGLGWDRGNEAGGLSAAEAHV